MNFDVCVTYISVCEDEMKQLNWFPWIEAKGDPPVATNNGEAIVEPPCKFCKHWNPQVIFNCGFDLNSLTGIVEKPEWQSLQAVQSGSVFTFDCALTCRTGPRIVDMVELLFKTLSSET